MWNGKNKAVTFSFDDGVTQDCKVIEILDKYGLKGTFNLNSSRFGLHFPYKDINKVVVRDVVDYDKIKDTYKNHEIASHSLTHANFYEIDEKAITWQIEQDCDTLEKFCDYNVVGFAYPCGQVDDRIAEIIKKNTRLKYARTVVSTHNFDLQNDLIKFNPTLHICEEGKIGWELLDKFVNMKADKPQLFYIWGHSYEFDISDRMHWQEFEEFCKALSGKEDIFYGTNRETLLF